MNTVRRLGAWFSSAFDVSRERTVAVVVAMIGVDALWWVLLYDGHVPMPGMGWLMDAGIPMAAPGAMELGVFHVGTLAAAVGYIVMWSVMMWAMMYPTMVRFVREYVAAHRGTSFAAALAVVGFLLGYQLIWGLSGVLPLALNALLPGGIYGVMRAHTHLVVGGALALTGIYQLSAFKRSQLRRCCPGVCSHAMGPVAAFGEGIEHGVRCLLICFGVFFLLMPIFGAMNFFWMVALTGVVALERFPTWGTEIATASGIVALVAGLVVLLVQPTLPVVFVM